jgi:hypothetical protein
MASRWASIVPSTRPFSRTERLRALSSPFVFARDLDRVRGDLGVDLGPFAQDQASGEVDLAAEPSQDLGVFASQGPFDVRLRVDDGSGAIHEASRMRGHSTVGRAGPGGAGRAGPRAGDDKNVK